ncbi:MAG: tetratricopeptide repeat protein [Thermoanaerobaculia bacterium]
MSVLIWGRRQKSIVLGAAGTTHCERCGAAREYVEVVDYTLNHVYYIFGFVSGRRILRRCTICGSSVPIAADAALEARARAAIPVSERLGCVGLLAGLAALVLVAVVWSMFGATPRNIPDLLAGVQRGDMKSLARLESEAEADDVPSQEALAQIYRDGQGVTPDPALAFHWAHRAAELGSAPAQFGLGAMYEFGRGVAVDPVQAAAWYRKADGQGVAGAANSLGALYLRGVGVPADSPAAVGWFRKAADGGDAAGQFNLAMRYWNGDGVPVDMQESRKWLERAAAATGQDATTLSVVASAKQELGVIYEEGEGIAADPVKALRYYEEASSLNEDARANFERLKARLKG